MMKVCLVEIGLSYNDIELTMISPAFHTPVERLENRPRLPVITSMFVFPTANVSALRYFIKEDAMI